jgi:hypothetical protein
MPRATRKHNKIRRSRERVPAWPAHSAPRWVIAPSLKGSLRGQVGTVVESLAPGVYEVEFSDDSGQTYASIALRAEQLMRLHHDPSHQAA